MIKLQIFGDCVLGEHMAYAKEIEMFWDGGAGEKGRIKIHGRITRVEFRKHFQY